MALAFTITLEKELADARAAYVRAGQGKALAREADRLDFSARRKNVPAITSLLSESHEALAAQMRAEGFDPAKMRLPPEQWYPAADGLKIVRALHDDVSSDLNKFKQPHPILRDLKSAEALLTAAEQAGVRFHFTKADV